MATAGERYSRQYDLLSPVDLAPLRGAPFCNYWGHVHA